MTTGMGYIQVKVPTHPAANSRGYVMEHRLVMESVVGRPLRRGEVVHHINHIKSDNRPENLILYRNHNEHVRSHHTEHLNPRPRDLGTGRFR